MKKMKFYSQYGQDRWLYDTFFTNKGPGVFMEIGADDGVDKSNTLFFEESLGWKGICIEPSPKRFKLLEQNRTCICENYAVSNTIDKVEFLDIAGWGKGLSGIIHKYHSRHRKRIQAEVRHPLNKGKEVVKVNTELLPNLLDKHNITEIDFCTIDTEGGEYDILSTIDFNKYNIRIIIVENNYGDNKIAKLLTDNGYKNIHKLTIDDVYIKQ
tara:strand:- start:80 stop:715 length:636 start_codon:yes stop_codon:yes gene_type:complete